jgi:tetratricopeptide (TPR) repeat protein
VTIAQNLEKMLAAGQDSAVLRYSLGGAYEKAGDLVRARDHLARAVGLDPDYSAAWKAYGKVLAALDLTEAAMAAFETGITVAERKGDIQAAKEMKVFLKRAKKKAGS